MGCGASTGNFNQALKDSPDRMKELTDKMLLDPGLKAAANAFRKTDPLHVDNADGTATAFGSFYNTWYGDYKSFKNEPYGQHYKSQSDAGKALFDALEKLCGTKADTPGWPMQSETPSNHENGLLGEMACLSSHLVLFGEGAGKQVCFSGDAGHGGIAPDTATVMQTIRDIFSECYYKMNGEERDVFPEDQFEKMWDEKMKARADIWNAARTVKEGHIEVKSVD